MRTASSAASTVALLYWPQLNGPPECQNRYGRTRVGPLMKSPNAVSKSPFWTRSYHVGRRHELELQIDADREQLALQRQRQAFERRIREQAASARSGLAERHAADT